MKISPLQGDRLAACREVIWGETMAQLGDVLPLLPDWHRRALRWFQEQEGVLVPWPQPLADGTLLATRAKGIYKPAQSAYALSVRQSLTSTYGDRDPVFHEDGSWTYLYHCEGGKGAPIEDDYTNRGLLAAMRDSVPVAVLRQERGKPNSQYRVLGLAAVLGMEGKWFLLRGFDRAGGAPDADEWVAAVAIDEVVLANTADAGSFDPTDIVDARERVLAAIMRRRGQPAFRKALMAAYGGRCAITGCDVTEVLEAAHIHPYLGPETNHVTNGILMRADIHTLFDLHLIAVEPSTLTVRIAPGLRGGDYESLHGVSLRVPSSDAFRPSAPALLARAERAGVSAWPVE